MKSSLLAVCLALCVSFALGATIPETNADVVEIEPKEVILPEAPAAFCPATCLFTGIYDLPHFNSCNRFYRCLHGFFFEFDCPAGQTFDHRELTCLPNAESRCILLGPPQ